jgi:hypothetical protein
MPTANGGLAPATRHIEELPLDRRVLEAVADGLVDILGDITALFGDGAAYQLDKEEQAGVAPVTIAEPGFLIGSGEGGEERPDQIAAILWREPN